MAASWSSKETTNDSFPDVYFGFLKISESATTAKNPTNQKRGYEISRAKDAHHVESTDTTPLWYRGKKTRV